MLSISLSAAVAGIEAYRVKVEVDIRNGFPSFATVGLPDKAVQESKERVIAAIRNSGFKFEMDRITVNLAPADVKKEGAAFDLPIALGILASSGQLPQDALGKYLILGELSLDGSIRSVKGVLPIVIALRDSKLEGIILPDDNKKGSSPN